MIERGRDIYNFRCYFCHGYNGDAKTLAASYLTPHPMDFTNAPDLTVDRILTALEQGRPGTAMKSFAKILTPEQRQDLATFVFEEFVAKKNINTYYHTKENGWPDHHERYEIAYPFALGEIAIDTPPDQLSDMQKAGLDLFKSSCISCHDRAKVLDPGQVWDKFPLSHQGCGVVCHEDGSISFPWNKGEARPTGHPATPYDAHAIAPIISDLSEQEKQGEALFQKNCSFCHAQDGTGKNWIGSFLEPHARDLTAPTTAQKLSAPQSLEKVIGDGIVGSSMPAWNKVLSPEDIASIAAYIRRAFFRDFN